MIRNHGKSLISDLAAPRRREVLGGMAGLAASTALVAPFGARPARAQEPKKGGHLKLAIAAGHTSDTLDPTIWTDTHAALVGLQVYNALVEIDENRQAKGELAESWEAGDSPDLWRFTLRKGVTFHNGKELDADDVIYSLGLHTAADSKSGAKPYMEQVTEMTADGKDKVVFKLTAPNADLPFLLSDYHLQIVPAGFNDWANTVGTGPFTLKRFEGGVTAEVARNPNYWKEGRGHVDSVETLCVNDTNARMSALQAGEVHYINRVDAKTAGLLQRSDKIQMAEALGGRFYPFVMITDRPPFDNNDLRLAIKYACDRERILQTVLLGHGYVGNDHPIPRIDPFFHSELPQRPYDPDKAKYHLKQAGMDSFSVDLSASDAAFANAVDAAVLYKESAVAGGIEINVVREAADNYWNDVWLKKPFCLSYWGGRPTADLMLSVAFEGGAPWNDTFWKRDDFDAMLREARGIVDFDKRKSLYWALQEMLSNEGGYLVPMFASDIAAASTEVGGVNSDPEQWLRVSERVWLES
ncbi:MAG: ABC transporter substrate-binding protein [Alphaproteobacteria bacterium]